MTDWLPFVLRPCAALSAFWLASAGLAAGAAAAQTEIAVCTGRADGSYARAAQILADELAASGVALTAVNTEGSLENIGMLADGACAGAIIQADAFWIHQRSNPEERLEIAPPVQLYDEYVHLICRRSAGIGDVAGLTGGEGRLLAGDAAGGSRLTWQALTGLAPAYETVPTSEIGGADAIEAILQDEEAVCLVQVIGLGSPFVTGLEDRAERLRLVPVDDDAFDDWEVAGTQIYRFAEIPGDAYGALQDGEPVPTISIGAVLVLSAGWAAANPEAYEAIRAAAEAARPAMAGSAAQP